MCPRISESRDGVPVLRAVPAPRGADNVAFGLRQRGVPRDEIERRGHEAMASVGLKGFDRRRLRELSGGEQQRVALARAVVVRPRFCCSTSHCRISTRGCASRCAAEMQRLQTELGLTTIYVTHDQTEALALADRIAVMRDGRIAQQGTPADIYERPSSVFVAQFVGFENVFRA